MTNTLVVDGRALVRETLRGRAGSRPPFIPFVHGMAARLAQTSSYDMAHDPTLMANCLAHAQALFGYDALVVGFDHTIIAEACGCEVGWDEAGPSLRSQPWTAGAVVGSEAVAKRGRVPVAVEVARRLQAVLGERAALLGVATGPWTLATQLYGQDFAKDWLAGAPGAVGCLTHAALVVLKICQQLGEVRVDGLLLAEANPLPDAPDRLDALRASYRPIWNVARFYNLPGILALREHRPASLPGLARLGGNALAAGRAVDGTSGAWSAPQVVAGRPLPAATLAGSPAAAGAIVAAIAASAAGSACFLTTEWEVPADTAPENLHVVVSAIRALSSPAGTATNEGEDVWATR